MRGLTRQDWVRQSTTKPYSRMNFEVTVQSTVAANESARIEMVHTHVLTRQRLGTFHFRRNSGDGDVRGAIAPSVNIGSIADLVRIAWRAGSSHMVVRASRALGQRWSRPVTALTGTGSYSHRGLFNIPLHIFRYSDSLRLDLQLS